MFLVKHYHVKIAYLDSTKNSYIRKLGFYILLKGEPWTDNKFVPWWPMVINSSLETVSICKGKATYNDPSSKL